MIDVVIVVYFRGRDRLLELTELLGYQLFDL